MLQLAQPKQAGQGAAVHRATPSASSRSTRRGQLGPGLLGGRAVVPVLLQEGLDLGPERARGVDLGVGAGDVGADLDQLLGVAVRGEQPAQGSGGGLLLGAW